MANSDNRKSTESIVGKDKAPRVPAEPTVKSVSNPVAVKGDEDTAKAGSLEDKLAAAIKSKGVDKVEVWKGDDNGLLYARMNKDGVNRLLSVDEDEAKDDTNEAAKSLVAQAGF
jgi:hypothetical protein